MLSPPRSRCSTAATAVEEVELADGRRLPCDAVVVGIGVVPGDRVAAWAPGSRRGGVPVATGGRTALPHVYAAGDAAMPFDERLRHAVRSEHWEAAARAGADAARGDARARARAPHAVQLLVGPVRPADPVRRPCARREMRSRSTARPPSATSRPLYRRAGRPVAALLVGRPHALPEMRRLIESRLADLFQALNEPQGDGMTKYAYRELIAALALVALGGLAGFAARCAARRRDREPSRSRPRSRCARR